MWLDLTFVHSILLQGSSLIHSTILERDTLCVSESSVSELIVSIQRKTTLFHLLSVNRESRNLLHAYVLSCVCVFVVCYMRSVVCVCPLCVMCAQLHACVLSCVCVLRLCAAPWTVACQAPLSMGCPRQKYWSWLPFPPPEDLPDPGNKPASPTSLAFAGRFFTTEPYGKQRFATKILILYYYSLTTLFSKLAE